MRQSTIKVLWKLPILLVILSGCVPGSTLQQTGRKNDLEQLIPELMEQAHIPGLSLALVEDGETSWLGSFGFADKKNGYPVRANTVFEAASLSKPVFAAALLQLVERGGFDLDQPLWQILPYKRLDQEPRAREITARMVLSHTSGLPNWGGTQLSLNFDPGSRFSYSGEGYIYLQKALEKQTGLTLNEFVRREVFDVLGMTQSSYIWNSAYRAVAATGHDPFEEPQQEYQFPEANAAASLHTTARDYGLFVAELLQPQKLALNTLAEMGTHQTAISGWGPKETHKFLGWGLGWGIQRGDSQTSYFHWGDNGTFRCFVLLYPGIKAGLVYFTNSQNGLAIARDLMTAAFPDTHHSLRWLSYEQFDDLIRVTRIRLQKAFLEEELETALIQLEDARKAQPEIVNEPFVTNLGSFLLSRQRTAEAVAVLEDNADRFPDSPAALDRLAEAYLQSGVWIQALMTSRKAYRLDPENEGAQIRNEWIHEHLETSRPRLDERVLKNLAGSYGPRQVSWRDGSLYYEREGVGLEYRLQAMSEDLFELEGLPTFRLQFVRDSEGNVTKVIGIYYDGRREESPLDR